MRTIAVAMLAAVAAATCGGGVITNSYATYAEAVEAGAVDRGWMPPLPANVYEIREAHAVDAPRRWGLFSFREADVRALEDLLGREVSVTGQTCEPPRRIEWWPVLLRGRLDDAQLAATGLKTYRLEGSGARAPAGVLTFAVNWNQRRAYYWSPG